MPQIEFCLTLRRRGWALEMPGIAIAAKSIKTQSRSERSWNHARMDMGHGWTALVSLSRWFPSCGVVPCATRLWGTKRPSRSWSGLVMSCDRHVVQLLVWYFQSNEISMKHIYVFFLGQTAFRFHHCPPVLVPQLKRFQYTRWSWAQCQTHHLHPLFHVSSTPAVKLSFQVSRTT